MSSEEIAREVRLKSMEMIRPRIDQLVTEIVNQCTSAMGTPEYKLMLRRKCMTWVIEKLAEQELKEMRG